MSGLIKRDVAYFDIPLSRVRFCKNTEQLRQYEIPGPKESHVLLPKLPRMLI